MSAVNDEPVRKRRKPHTRALKACEHCRKQKTRCLRTENSTSCFRCVSLKLSCSLNNDIITNMNINNSMTSNMPLNNMNLSMRGDSLPISFNIPPTTLPSQLNNATTTLRKSSQPTPPFQALTSFEPGNNIMPSINNDSANGLYERLPSSSATQSHPLRVSQSQPLRTSPSPFPQRYPELIQQLYVPHVPSPKLSQQFAQNPPLSTFSSDIMDQEHKLDIINNNVAEILNLITLNNNVVNSSNNLHSVNSLNSIKSDYLPILQEPVNLSNISTQYHALAPINFLKTLAETEIDKDNADSGGSLPLCLQQQLYPSHTFRPPYEDILTSNILSLPDTIKLIDIFRDRYGRWLSFPSLISTKVLIKRIRLRCPLLLTASCFLSLKYGDPLLKAKVWDKLYTIISREIHWLTSTYSGSLEELQCLVILGAYSCELSDSVYNNNLDKSTLLLLDGWYLSGIGLTLFEKINGYGLLDQMYGHETENLWKKNKNIIERKIGKFDTTVRSPNRINLISEIIRDDPDEQNEYNDNGEDYDEYDDDDVDDNDEFNLLTLHRLWNGLVLIQLAYCLLYGRKSWISLDRLKPREVADIASATNFDFRIISEIHIYLLGYKHILLNDDYEDTVNGVKTWFNKWNVTFGQPSNQFIEIDYHLVQSLIKIKQIKIDINSILIISKESILTIFDKIPNLLGLKLHTVAIVNLITTVTDDSYFAFLSDQIHLTIFYSTNILISVLSILSKIKKSIDSVDIEINGHNNNAEILSKIENYILENDLLKRIKNLYLRYRTVATTKDDVYFKYYYILEKNFTSKLLEFL